MDLNVTKDELAIILNHLVDAAVFVREFEMEDENTASKELDELIDKLKWEKNRGQYRWRLNPHWEILQIVGGWALFENDRFLGHEADLTAAKDRLELLWRTEGKGVHA
mgnify:CR=1 FL=1